MEHLIKLLHQHDKRLYKFLSSSIEIGEQLKHEMFALEPMKQFSLDLLQLSSFILIDIVNLHSICQNLPNEIDTLHWDDSQHLTSLSSHRIKKKYLQNSILVFASKSTYR